MKTFFTISLLLVLSVRSSAGQAELKNTTLVNPCEIAILVDGSASVKDDEFKLMVEVVRQLPDQFQMDDKNTRVAVIVFSDKPEVVLNLTANDSLVRALDPSRPKNVTATNEALKEVKMVFVNARPEATKIVILMTHGVPYDGHDYLVRETERAAAELKNEGSIIYVVYPGFNVRDPESERHMENVAGDQSQVFRLSDFSQLKKTVFGDIPKHIICHFEEICRFEDADQMVCNAAWYRPITDMNCSNSPPDRPLRQCNNSHCEETCDHKWKWEPCDQTSAGEEQTIKRDGPTPHPVFEHCDAEKKEVCPTVSTIPTTSGPSTEGPPPTGPSSTGSGNAPAVVPTRPGHERRKDESDLAPWMIAIIAVCSVLVAQMVAVLSAVAYHSRRKKMRTRDAEKRLKEDTAKKDKRVADVEKSTKKTQPNEMSSRAFGVDEQLSVGGKAADDSVQVSLRDVKKAGGSSVGKMPKPKVGVTSQSLGSKAGEKPERN